VHVLAGLAIDSIIRLIYSIKPFNFASFPTACIPIAPTESVTIFFIIYVVQLLLEKLDNYHFSLMLSSGTVALNI
jgi:hypothetical protein